MASKEKDEAQCTQERNIVEEGERMKQAHSTDEESGP
jgi:hypothetical protein